MKKLWMLILCMGIITFAFGACNLSDSATSSNDTTESSESIENPEGSSEEGSNDSSSNSSEDSTGDSSGDSSSLTPPIIDGDNEMPLVPIG